jgi:putative metallohydrolase (TIGR04338 family)
VSATGAATRASPRRLGSHQAALYAAEAVSIAALGITWPRLADAQRYLDGLVGSAWFAGRWPHFRGATVQRRGHRAVWSLGAALDDAGPDGRPTEGAVLVAGPLRQPVVLHELAHLLLPPGAGHGPAFAETLLTLVRAEMGFPAFAELFHALRRHDAFRGVSEGLAVPA